MDGRQSGREERGRLEPPRSGRGGSSPVSGTGCVVETCVREQRKFRRGPHVPTPPSPGVSERPATLARTPPRLTGARSAPCSWKRAPRRCDFNTCGPLFTSTKVPCAIQKLTLFARWCVDAPFCGQLALGSLPVRSDELLGSGFYVPLIWQAPTTDIRCTLSPNTQQCRAVHWKTVRSAVDQSATRSGPIGHWVPGARLVA